MARLPDDEIARRLAEAMDQVKISDEEMRERWPDLPAHKQESRRNQAQIARAKHLVVVDDETGQRLLGGPQPRGSMRSRKDIAEAIAELADGDRQKEIIDGLFSGLSPDESPAVRGKAAERIVTIANDQREKERRDRDELRTMGKDALIEMIVGGLLSTGMDEDLAKRLQPAKSYDADAEAVELP